LNAWKIASRDAEHHIHEFAQPKSLSLYRANADVIGFLFRKTYGDGFREWHGVKYALSGAPSACPQASTDAVAEGLAVYSFAF